MDIELGPEFGLEQEWLKRIKNSVSFEYALPAQMMAIDGTWRRSCNVKEISDARATLQVEASIEGLVLSEFFLLLSSTGLAYRRCQLDRVNGAELQVRFVRQKKKKMRS
jgi:hypothetical protein